MSQLGYLFEYHYPKMKQLEDQLAELRAENDRLKAVPSTEDEFRSSISRYLAKLTTWEAIVRAAFVTNAEFDVHRERILKAARPSPAPQAEPRGVVPPDPRPYVPHPNPFHVPEDHE